MALKRFSQLLIWRIRQVDQIWWLLLVFILMIEALVLLKYRGSENFRRVVRWCIFILYLSFVLIVTVFSRSIMPQGNSGISFNISTAWTFGPGMYGPIDTVAELILNIIMFIPFGYLVMKISERTSLALATSLLITLLIETIQLITNRGFFEIADILLNFTGAVIGWLVYWIVRRIH